MMIIALSLHLYLIHLATATCYYPDDSVTPEDVSCRYTGNSSCCSIGWICLSNGLCQNPNPTTNDHGGGKYYRGSCTDPTFDSPNCAAVCLKPGVDTLNDAAEIVWCNSFGGRDYFYCYHPSDTTVPDCSAGTTDTRIIHLPANPSALTTIGQAATSTTSTSTSSSASPSSSSSPTSAATQNTVVTTTIIQSQTSTPGTKPSSNSHAVAISAGVGVPLALALICGMIFLLWRLFGRHKAGTRSAQEMEASSYGSPHAIGVDPSWRKSELSSPSPVFVEQRHELHAPVYEGT